MQTTLNLKKDLIKKAMEETGIKEKTALIHRGLQLLIQHAAIERLIQLGGKLPKARVPRRRRSKK